MMKRLLAMAILLLLLSGATASAQTVLMLEGNPLLQVTAGANPPDPMSVQNTTGRLLWWRRNFLAKIVVSTSCPGQKFGLRVYAVSPSEGTAAPEVILSHGMPPVDFVTNCPPGGPILNIATLRYTAVASFAQGNSTELGNDVHVITYTITAQ